MICRILVTKGLIDDDWYVDQIFNLKKNDEVCKRIGQKISADNIKVYVVCVSEVILYVVFL